MATAATSLLGLALPVTGELSGTWGDTVNVSITALLDTAVAGTTTLSSDSDVTLTTTTLAANQARQAIILWTAGGTVTRTITAPAQSKSYIVINKTSSSQSIKIVGVGPTTGVTIVAGTAAFVVWNGVDFVTASVTSTTGILPVANGGTGLSSGTSGGVLAYTATGTLASSAALAANALVIGGGAGAAPSTTTTGTGVVTALGVNVGTAGAFVVNGGALGTPSSGTVTNLTGTASININGTVGATTPTTGAFTTLSATGTLTLSATNGLITSGTTDASDNKTITISGGGANSAARGANFSLSGNESTTEIITVGGDAILQSGNTAGAAVYIYQGTAGQIAKFSSTGLAVTGTLSATGQVTASGATNGFVTDATNGYALFSGDPANYNISRNSLDIQIKSASTIGALISGTRILSVSSTGLAVTGALSATDDITLTANSAELYLNGGSSTAQGGYVSISRGGTPKILLGTASNVIGGGSNTSDDLALFATAESRFYASSAEQMRLTSTGLGIGTSSPVYQTQIYGSGQTTAALTDSGNKGGSLLLNTPTVAGGDGGALLIGAGGAGAKPFAAIKGLLADGGGNTTGSLAFSTRNATGDTSLTERMRLDSSGNLGLGVTPSVWSASTKALQIGNGISLWSTSDTNNFLSQNLYLDATSTYRWITANPATNFSQSNGAFTWALAAGTPSAGGAIGSFSTYMTLDASGNLGIGTTSAYQKLSIGGINATNNTNQNSIEFQDTNGNLNFRITGGRGSSGNEGYGVFSTTTGGVMTERMRLNSSGNLGIGTTSPDCRLMLETPSGTACQLNLSQSAVTNYRLSIPASTDALTFVYGASTERMRLDSSGALLIGVTSSSTTVFQEIKYTTAATGTRYINTSSSASNVMDFVAASSQVGSITTSGSATLYNVTSDYRLKTVNGAVSGQGSRIDALQPIEYTWNSNGSSTRGFLAHQFQEVYPSSVTGTKDAVDADGKPVYQAMQASTSEVIADLVAELQSLRARVAQLESKP